LLNPDLTVQTAAFRFPTVAMAALDLFPLPALVPGRVRYRLAHSRLNGRYPREKSARSPFKIDHPLGACMLVRRQAYEEIGGFDERLFMYSEEVDLALRYARAGWECVQVPSARVVHLGGQSTKQVPGRMFVELWRSRLYILRKHYTVPALWAVKMLLAAAQLRDLARVALGRTTGRLTGREARAHIRVAGEVLRVTWRA
jgi:GT2 family glycosyltransferase